MIIVSMMTAAQFEAALRAEGCKVEPHAGWASHNRNSKGEWGPLNGVMLHHDAGNDNEANMVDLVWNGRSDLPGPLCHAYIAKDGSVHLIGWGRANHAGGGDPDVLAAVVAERYPLPKTDKHEGESGATDGNPHFVGYECENKGDGKDPWPAVQVDAMVRATAAVCRKFGWSANSAIRHLDWSDWKNDPRGLDWNAFRKALSARLAGPASAPGTTPPPDTSEPPSTPPKASDAFPGAGRFGPGQNNADVTRLGQMLSKRGGARFYTVGPGPKWSDADRDATRAFQQAQGWTGEDANGIPGPTTWDYLVNGKGKNIPAAPKALPVVSVANVIAAYKHDRPAKTGATSHPGDVKLVEAALDKLNYLAPTYAKDGSFGTTTESAYNAFRRAIGMKGSDAVGAPGKTSLVELGKRSGLFTVKN